MQLQKKELHSNYQRGRAAKTESTVQLQTLAAVSRLTKFAAFWALSVCFFSPPTGYSKISAGSSAAVPLHQARPRPSMLNSGLSPGRKTFSRSKVPNLTMQLVQLTQVSCDRRQLQQLGAGRLTSR